MFGSTSSQVFFISFGDSASIMAAVPINPPIAKAAGEARAAPADKAPIPAMATTTVAKSLSGVPCCCTLIVEHMMVSS